MMIQYATPRMTDTLPADVNEMVDELASLHPLRLARLEQNLTQRMLADFTQLSVPTIKRAESGKPLRLDVHYRLCQYFGKTSRELGLRHQGKRLCIPARLDTSVPVSGEYALSAHGSVEAYFEYVS